MLEIIREIIDNHVSQSSSYQYTEENEEYKVVEIFLEKCLQSGELFSEYIFFAYPMKKKIRCQECNDIENAVSIDIYGTDRKCDHAFNII